MKSANPGNLIASSVGFRRDSAAEAGHAFGRVGRKPDPRRFSVITDVDSTLQLTLDDQVEVMFDLGFEHIGFIGLALFALDEQR